MSVAVAGHRGSRCRTPVIVIILLVVLVGLVCLATVLSGEQGIDALFGGLTRPATLRAIDIDGSELMGSLNVSANESDVMLEDPDADYVVHRRLLAGSRVRSRPARVRKSAVVAVPAVGSPAAKALLSKNKVQPLPPDDVDSPAARNACPIPFNRSLSWTAAAYLAELGGPDAFCRKRNSTARNASQVKNVYFGAMLNFELSMLEVVLHEIAPLIETIVIVESTTSHSLEFKAPIWPSQASDPRWTPFHSKIDHQMWYLDPLSMKYSGWTVERGQREAYILRLMQMQIPDGSIVIANMDLDEIPTRETVMYWKYCNVPPEGLSFQRLHFRYNMRCLQPVIWFDAAGAGSTVYYWPSGFPAQKGKLESVYKARSNRRAPNPQPQPQEVEGLFLGLNAAFWHLSTFGGADAVMMKNAHSPHTHLRTNRSAVESNIQSCVVAGEKGPMLNKQFGDEAIPLLMRRNRCHFERLQWL